MAKPPVVLVSPATKPKDRYLRWFSRRHATRYKRSAMGDAEFVALSHLVVSNDNKLAYVKNPKAACTTIGAALYQYCYGDSFFENIHATDKLSQGSKCLENNVKAIDEGATLFSFARDPVSRCRSAFIDFFIDKKNDAAGKHFKAIEARGFSLKEDAHYRLDVFLSYIEESMAESSHLTDPHWRSQTLNTGIHVLPLAYVGRIEDGLERGLNIVSELAGCTGLQPAQRHLNASSKTDFEPNKPQVAKIQRLYAEDYDSFGY